MSAPGGGGRPVVAQEGDAGAAARARGVDEPAVAQRDAGVADRPLGAPGSARTEEDEIPRLEVGGRDLLGGVLEGHRVGGAAEQPAAERHLAGLRAALEGPPHQARAVEPAVGLRAPGRGGGGRGPVARPDVGLADLPHGGLDHREALRVHRRQVDVAVARELGPLPGAHAPGAVEHVDQIGEAHRLAPRALAAVARRRLVVDEAQLADEHLAARVGGHEEGGAAVHGQALDAAALGVEPERVDECRVRRPHAERRGGVGARLRHAGEDAEGGVQVGPGRVAREVGAGEARPRGGHAGGGRVGPGVEVQPGAVGATGVGAGPTGAGATGAGAGAGGAGAWAGTWVPGGGHGGCGGAGRLRLRRRRPGAPEGGQGDDEREEEFPRHSPWFGVRGAGLDPRGRDGPDLCKSPRRSIFDAERSAMARDPNPTDQDWRERLSPEQFAVTRQGATERAFTGIYWDHHGDGVYACVCCGEPLFDSETKFESGIGVAELLRAGHRRGRGPRGPSHGMVRTEVVCRRCGAHLGHVFEDGPASHRAALLHQLGVPRVRGAGEG